MRRILAPVALLTVIALAMPSHAGSFTYEDPADMPANGGLDIRKVTYSTLGKGKGKAYVPSTLVVSLTLGAAPVAQPVFKYEVEAEVEDCGTVTFSYAAGTLLGGTAGGPGILYLGCGGADPIAGDGLILFPKSEVKGSTITWTIGLKSLPKQVRAGAVLTELEATVDIVEPLLGIQGSEETGGPAIIDTATTDQTWTIS